MGDCRPLARIFIILLSTLELAFFSVGAANASPWGRENNELFVLTRADYFQARGDFLPTTPSDTSDLFQRLETNTFVEFGVTDALMIGGKMIYGTSWVSNEIESITASGFSEVEGFVQHRLFKGRRDVGAIRLAGAAPNSFDTGMRERLVSDGPSAEIRGLYGRTFRDGRFGLYGGVEMAYRRRFGDAADQTVIDATVGLEATPRLLLLVQSFNTISLRNEQNDGSDFDVYRVQPSLVWRGGKSWALEAGVIHEYAGRNFNRGNTFFLGLWTLF